MAIELEDGKGVLFSNTAEAFNGRIKVHGQECSIVGTLRETSRGQIVAVSVEAGALFPKDNLTNPRAPNYSGVLDLFGEKIKISGWLKTTDKGKMVSLAHNTYGEAAPTDNRPKEVRRGRDDDDLPF
jgi:hypothetical protein